MGALGTRHSLRPLLIEARTVLQNSGAPRGEIADAHPKIVLAV
jgi:hypothetical protein